MSFCNVVDVNCDELRWVDFYSSEYTSESAERKIRVLEAFVEFTFKTVKDE